MSISVTEQVVRVVSEAEGAVVVVVEPVTQVVEVGVVGPQGATGALGPQGPQGPQGAPGAATGSYRHVQAVPSATWTVPHNLGMYPNVLVLDTLGRVVEGDMAFPDLNTVVLTFSAAFSGDAFVS